MHKNKAMPNLNQNADSYIHCKTNELIWLKKELLDGIQETYFGSIPGTSDNDTTLVQPR